MDLGVDIAASGAGLLFVDDFFFGRCVVSRDKLSEASACIIWKKGESGEHEARKRR